MMNLNDVMKMLQGEVEKNTIEIQNLSDAIELKEQEILNAENNIALLESCMTQLLEQKEKLEEEYAKLIMDVKCKKATSFIPSKLNKLLTNDEENIAEKTMSLSYKASGALNDCRYKIRNNVDMCEQEIDNIADSLLDCVKELRQLKNK